MAKFPVLQKLTHISPEIGLSVLNCATEKGESVSASPAQPSPAQPSPDQPSSETALIDTKTRWIKLQRGGAGNPPIDPFGLHRSSTPEN